MPLAIIDKLELAYGHWPLLNGASLVIDAGERLGLVGLGTLTAGFLSIGTITAEAGVHGTTTVHMPVGLNVSLAR